MKDGSTSERILAVAFRLLSERGYAHVSLRDIAGEANVAVSQIAYHFKNKAGLFSAVIERMARVIVEEGSRFLTGTTDSREWVRALTEFAVNFMSARPEYMRVMLDLLAQSQWEKSFRDELAKLAEKYDSVACRVLDGKKYSVRAMASCALGMLLGTSVQVSLGIQDAAEALRFGENILLGMQE